MDQYLLIVLYLLTGLIVFIGTLANSRIGLFSIVISMFFLYPQLYIFGAHVKIVDVTTLSSLIAWVSQMLVRGKLNVSRSPFNIAIFIFIVSIAVSAIGAISPAKSIINLLQAFGWVGCYFFFANNVSSVIQGQKLILSILWMAVIQVLVGFFQILTNTGGLFIEGGMPRMVGTLGPYLPTYILSGIIVGLGLVFYRAQQVKYFILTMLLIFGLILVQTRTVWISLLFGVIVSIFVKRISLKVRAAVSIGIILVIFSMFIFLVYFVPAYWTTLADRGIDSMYIRLYLWQSALNIWSTSPITGAGIGNFGLLYMDFTFDKFGKTVTDLFLLHSLSDAIDAHSTFLTYLAETGLVGVGAYLSVILIGIIVSYRTFKRYRNAFNLSLFIYMAVTIVAIFYSEPPGGHIGYLQWIIMGLITAAYNWNKTCQDNQGHTKQ